MKRPLLLYGLLGIATIALWIAFCSLGQPLTEGIDRAGWWGKPSLYTAATLFLDPFGASQVRGANYMAAAVLAFLMCMTFKGIQRSDREGMILLISLSLSLPLVSFALSYLIPVSVWAPRQMVGSLVCYVMLSGLALTFVRVRLSILLAMLLIIWCIANVSQAFPVNSRPPWRAIGSVLSQKYPEHQIFGQEWSVLYPLQFYMQSNQKVYSVDEVYVGSKNHARPWGRVLAPPSDVDKAYVGSKDHAVYVCRPTSCEQLNEMKQHYTMENSLTFTWGNKDFINAYVLQKK